MHVFSCKYFIVLCINISVSIINTEQTSMIVQVFENLYKYSMLELCTLSTVYLLLCK